MKNTLRILILAGSLLLSENLSLAQWNWTWCNPTPTGSTIFDVWRFSSTELLAVGTGGLIMKSIDGGASWTITPSGVMRNLYALWFVDTNTGWACGVDGLLLKTTNHGSTWEAIETGAYTLNDICFVGTIGWACGENGMIIKTTDGGDNWTSLNTGTTNSLSSIVFKTASEGYVAGGDGTLLKTLNGGGIWGLKAVGTSNNLTCVRITGSTIFVFGSSSTAYKTTNGGTNWTAVNTGLSGDISSAEVLDANNIWAVGNGGIVFYTSDGGANWNNKNPWIGDIDFGHPTITGSFRYASFSSASSGIICGVNGVIYQTTDNGTIWTPRMNRFTAGNASGITFSDSQHGLLLTDTLFRTANGGTTWTKMENTDGIRHVQLFPDGTGIRFNNAGASPHFETTSNHGETWITNNGIASDGNYWFINTSVGYAIPYGTAFYKTITGGVSWTSLSHDYIDIYAGFSVPEANTIWILEWADGNNLIVSSNGGGIWNTPEANLLPGSRSSIFSFDSENAWVGSSGMLYKTTDGGDNFTEIDPQVNGNWINSIKFISSTTGFVAATNGYLSVTTDGGATWNPAVMGNSSWTKIAVASATSVFIAGDGGSVVMGTNGVPTSVEEPHIIFPSGFSLDQNYPNPVSLLTTIKYHIPFNSFVSLKVFNLSGKELKTLVNEMQNPGVHSVTFSAGNLPHGLYLFKLQAGKYSSSKKFLIMK